MKNAIFSAFVALSVAATGSTAAQAATAQAVQLVGSVKVDKLVTTAGVPKHVLLDPKTVVPGDHLVFSTGYINTSGKPVANFVVTNPVPAGVAYAADGGTALTVSCDGGKTWGALAALTVATADGKRRAAQPGDVTHIRWKLPLLAPGAAGSLTYNAIVR